MRIVRSPDGNIDPIDRELAALRIFKETVVEMQQEVEEQTKLVVDMLTERGQKSIQREGYRYTIQQAERTVINENGLRKALGARLFNKMTIRKLDKAKLDELIQQGEVDPVVVSQYAEIQLNKPAVRVSELSLEQAHE